LPDPTLEKHLVAVCSKKFQNPFFLKTTDRTFALYAPTYEERRMWMAGFDYVIKSTVIVQKIIEQNAREA
jgi:hypothetical protein